MPRYLKGPRGARLIQFGGVRKSISAWARDLGISRRCLSHRLNGGWPIRKAFQNPSGLKLNGVRYGEGYKHQGYVRTSKGGQQRGEHVRIAEKILGRPLPPGVVVHHVNSDGTDNRHENLVICPSDAYHNLLHRRARAFDACGHVDWRKCKICRQWDKPENLVIYKTSVTHRICNKVYSRMSYVRRKSRRSIWVKN